MNSNQGYPTSKEGKVVANNSNSCEIGGKAPDTSDKELYHARQQLAYIYLPLLWNSVFHKTGI